ncbi:MAG: hypothetical protein UX07_C0012G0009 [Parcubacteria group bacterium GW2011_GWA2_45_30]|nr:MAG: hypothetical protein UX07_C0012G0009 [Parcubacteria group bacterium GW2011_GWA2_45_30]
MASRAFRLSLEQKKRIQKNIREKVWGPEVRKFLRAHRKRDIKFLYNLVKFEPKKFVLAQISEVFLQKYHQKL